MGKLIKVLSTKLLSPDVLQQAKQHNISIDCVPVIDVVSVITEDTAHILNEFKYKSCVVIFTSSKALHFVKSFVSGTEPWTIYCTSQSTSQQVQQHFKAGQIIYLGNDALDIANQIISREANSTQPIYYLSALNPLPTLPNLLRAQCKDRFTLLPVYKTVATSFKVNWSVYKAILFFSPSAIDSVMSQEQSIPSMPVFVLGSSTQKHAQQFFSSPIITAKQHTQQSMLEAVVHYFNS